ncbi:MAG: hypothetical protein R3E76_10605 [Planctomycetota bacterium]
MLPLLAKTQETASTGMTLAEIIGYGALAFLLVFALVSTRIVLECARKRYVHPAIMAAVLYLTSLGPAAMILMAMYGVLPAADWMIPAAIGGSVLWVVALVVYSVISSKKKKQMDAEQASAEAAAEAAIYNDDHASMRYAERTGQATSQPTDDTFEAVEADERPDGPRRAVSLPVAESDSQRASEQTLKRMTIEQVESASQASKAPRASEIPENPILDDGPCKVRCLACDKKMLSDGAKFMKQRRCPNCKAAPFRYVTAV